MAGRSGPTPIVPAMDATNARVIVHYSVLGAVERLHFRETSSIHSHRLIAAGAARVLRRRQARMLEGLRLSQGDTGDSDSKRGKGGRVFG